MSNRRFVEEGSPSLLDDQGDTSSSLPYFDSRQPYDEFSQNAQDPYDVLSDYEGSEAPTLSPRGSPIDDYEAIEPGPGAVGAGLPVASAAAASSPEAGPALRFGGDRSPPNSPELQGQSNARTRLASSAFPESSSRPLDLTVTVGGKTYNVEGVSVTEL